MRREARLLKAKAIASLRRAAQAFNSLEDDGRVTTVLLHSQHGFEMLLKAALVERRQRVFEAEHWRDASSACGLGQTSIRTSARCPPGSRTGETRARPP